MATNNAAASTRSSSIAILIDQTSHQWKESAISQLVSPTDHHLIRKIYLPLRSQRDSYLWSHTKDGKYTVKSGYWTAATAILRDDDRKPPLANHTDIATNIWKLNLSQTETFYMEACIKSTGGCCEFTSA